MQINKINKKYGLISVKRSGFS